MRIAIVHLEYSRRGGIERASAELSDRLAIKGHEVHFYCVRWTDVNNTSVRFHKVPTIGIVNSTRLLTFALNAPKQIQGNSYDIVHSHGGVVGSDVITAHSCHLAGIRVLRNQQIQTVQPRLNFGIADNIRLIIERRNYFGRRYKKVIAVSEGVKQELAECYGVPSEDIAVIPNGVDIQAFHPCLRQDKGWKVRGQLGISEHDKVIILIANEFERKGLEYVIKALAIIRDPKIKLLVVGKDNPQSYRRLANSVEVDRQIVFTGATSNIAEYYAAADIFVFPSYYEAFPLSLLEAAASGLPLMVTKVHGAVDFVRDAFNGYFIRRDAEDIASVLKRLIYDKALLRDLGNNARGSAEQFSWENITEKTLALFQQVIEMKLKK